MYINNLFETNKSFKQLAKEGSTFSVSYDYWLNALFERAMRLFVWKNTYNEEKKTGILPRHIESILLMNGTCGISDKYKNTLNAFYGMFSGKPTVYYDEFTEYSIYSPVYSKNLNCINDAEVVVMNNNSIRNSIYPMCHRYAITLAHIEVSLVNTLINGRDSGGIPVVTTESQRQSVIEYRNSLCNGKVGTILDPSFSGVNFVGVNKNTTLQIKDLVEVRENTLDSFYSDLGVKTSYNKKGNMIVEEVNANNSMLLLNISDMLNQRKRDAERVNKRFGTEWSVELAEELQYNKENLQIYEDKMQITEKEDNINE